MKTYKKFIFHLDTLKNILKDYYKINFLKIKIKSEMIIKVTFFVNYFFRLEIC